MNTEQIPEFDSTPTVICPHCGASQRDYDGFGVVHCSTCHYCAHPDCTREPGGVTVCSLCGSRVRDFIEVEFPQAYPDDRPADWFDLGGEG